MTDDRMPGDEATATDPSDYLPESLKRPPIIDILNSTPTGQQQIKLIKATVAKGANDAEVAQFLELCAQYGLDWNAHEAWCAVSERNGTRNVLLMVGRNGLRKIAQRQGFRMIGDVIREKDEFKVVASAGCHAVVHTYRGITEDQRGPITGAWAQVLDDGGNERGFFVAPLSEYLPTSEKKLQYSPWGAQRSTMILAAAERQALSQATPLGGLLAQGELDRAGENLQIVSGDGEPAGIDLGPKVEALMERARRVGHAGLADRGNLELRLGGQTPAYVDDYVAEANKELDRIEAEHGESVDAEAVEEPEGAKA